jgi:hypothetical protein
MKELFKCHTLKQPKLKQLKKALCKWLTAILSDRRELTGAIIIEKATSFYNEMNINDKST